MNAIIMVTLVIVLSCLTVCRADGFDFGDVGDFIFGGSDSDAADEVDAPFKAQFSPKPEPFNKYLGSLELRLPVQKVTTSGVELSFGPVACSHAGYSGASVKPDSKVTALNTAISGMAITCTSPYEAKYKLLHTSGSLSLATKNAMLLTSVAPSNGSNPPKDGTLPKTMQMSGCSMDAGDVDINFQGHGPLVAILNKLKKHILSMVVSKGETQVCEVLEKAINEQATGTLALLESYLLN